MKFILIAIIGLILVIGIWVYFREFGYRQAKLRQGSSFIATPSPGSFTSNPKISKITGWVHTEGTKLVDESGNEIRLVGLTANGMEIGQGYPGSEGKQKIGCRGWEAPTQKEYENFSAWGFNLTRVPLSWANLEPNPPTKNADGSFTHAWNQRYLEDVDKIVEEFGKRGIPIIIGLHQFNWSPAFRDIKVALGNFCQGQGMPVWSVPDANKTNQAQALCDFFANKTPDGVAIDLQQGFIEASKFLAERYRDNSTVVGLDIFNEPFPKSKCPAKDLNLANFYQKMGSEIRAANKNILLIFEEGRGKVKEADFSLDSPPNFSNVVYSFHIYPKSSDVGIAISSEFLARAKKWNVPLWLGEWGAIGAQNADVTKDQAEENSKLLQYWRENNIGFAYWAYWGGWGLTNKDNLTKPKLLKVLKYGL